MLIQTHEILLTISLDHLFTLFGLGDECILDREREPAANHSRASCQTAERKHYFKNTLLLSHFLLKRKLNL